MTLPTEVETLLNCHLRDELEPGIAALSPQLLAASLACDPLLPDWTAHQVAEGLERGLQLLHRGPDLMRFPLLADILYAPIPGTGLTRADLVPLKDEVRDVRAAVGQLRQTSLHTEQRVGIAGRQLRNLELWRMEAAVREQVALLVRDVAPGLRAVLFHLVEAARPRFTHQLRPGGPREPVRVERPVHEEESFVAALRQFVIDAPRAERPEPPAEIDFDQARQELARGRDVHVEQFLRHVGRELPRVLRQFEPHLAGFRSFVERAARAQALSELLGRVPGFGLRNALADALLND